jgi:hypothetical protein
MQKSKQFLSLHDGCPVLPHVEIITLPLSILLILSEMRMQDQVISPEFRISWRTHINAP